MAAAAQGEFMVLNGALVPYAEARVHALAPGLTFAAAVFEGIRGYRNTDQGRTYLFRLDDHLERLQYSMRVMRFAGGPDSATLREATLRLVAANALAGDCYLRIQAFIDGDGSMAATGPVSWFVSCGGRGRSPLAATGARVGVSSWTRIADNATPPRVKGVANYVNGRLASIQAKHDGYDNALILNAQGQVAEAPGACVFIVRNGVLATPGGADFILESITRDTLIRMAPDWVGQGVAERPIGRTELYGAEEVFLCGTGAEVMPVVAVDGVPVGDGAPGRLTMELQRRYFDLVRGIDPARQDWRTAA